MLGAVPLSKLQFTPLALAAGFGWLWAEWRAPGPDQTPHRVYLLGGAVLPAVLLLTPVLISGQWHHFVLSYLGANLSYAATGYSSFGQLWQDLWAKSLEEDSLLHLWIPGTLLWCGLALGVRAAPDRTGRGFAWLALGATLISLFCVFRAGRPFLHYWQIVVPALTLLLGSLLGNTGAPGGPAKTGRFLVLGGALALFAVLGGHRLLQPNFFVGSLAYFQANPRSALADRVLRHAQPGEAIAIWGSTNYVYVETGLRQATHDSAFERSILPGTYQAYFRDRFLADLMVTRPAFFLDSSGPSTLIFQDPRLAHDRNYPELAAVIRADYVQVDEISGARLYRRRDLPAR
jgi:hypothetical protein